MIESVDTTPPDEHGAAPPRPARLGVAVLVAGLVGAVALPVTGVGIGWAVAAIALLGVVVAARSRRPPTREPGPIGRIEYVDRAWRCAAGVTALFLVATAGVRAAGWLVALCLVTSVALASYALTGGRSWVGLMRAGTALVPAVGKGLSPDEAGVDGAAGLRAAARIGVGLAAGVVLVLVFGGLLRSADPAFANLVAGWHEAISVGAILRATAGFGLVSAIALGAAHLAIRGSAIRGLPNQRSANQGLPNEGSANQSSAGLGSPGLGSAGPGSVARGLVDWSRASEPGPPAQDRRRLGLAEWVIPLSMLDGLFGIFVWVQVTVLFADDAYVLGPGGPDYAVNARNGSLQLGLVTCLTLGVVAALIRWVNPGRAAGAVNPRQAAGARSLPATLLRVLGGVLCGLTLVIVASALFRLSLYAGAYGYTPPRLLVFAGETWLGLVFVLLLLAGVRLRGDWLPRAIVASAVAVLIGLAAINPEARMAETHIDRLTRSYPVDPNFLAHLSADAFDQLDQLAEPERSCVLSLLVRDLAQPEPWYRWNTARAHARAVLATRPTVATCDFAPSTPGLIPMPGRARQDG